MKKFKTRNPKIATCIGKKIDAKRIKATQPKTINEFYDQFKAAQIEYNITLENIWNIDEHRIELGSCTNSRVLSEVEEKYAYV